MSERQPGRMRAGGGGPLTVGDVRDAIADLDDGVEFCFGELPPGFELQFDGFEVLDERGGAKRLFLRLRNDFDPGEPMPNSNTLLE